MNNMVTRPKRVTIRRVLAYDNCWRKCTNSWLYSNNKYNNYVS